MTSSWTRRVCALAAIPLACAFPATAQENILARSAEGGFDDILVTAKQGDGDTTRMAADSAALLHVAGTVSDPVQALLTLPGISFGGSDLDRPVVRGAGPGDNLFLVDGIPLPDLFHDLGDSIVMPAALRSFDLSSAAFPLRFGGATGGVIDIALRDPALDGAHAQIEASQIKVAGFIEAPLTDRLSVYAGGRYNLAHLFVGSFGPGTRLVEYRMPRSADYVGRARWSGSGFDLTASTLGSRDERRETQRPELGIAPRYGQIERRRFDAQALRLNVPLGPSGTWTTVASHVAASDRTTYAAGDRIAFATDTLSLRSDLTLPLGAVTLDTGINLRRDRLTVSVTGAVPLCDYLDTRCIVAVSGSNAPHRRRFDSIEGFAGITLPLSRSLTAEIGGRLVHDAALDATMVEPRASLEWRPAESIALFVRGRRVHGRPDPARLAFDLAAVRDMRLPASWQAAGGIRARVGGWNAQVEAWWKDFRLDDLIGTPIESRVAGTARGIDLLISAPNGGQFDGWLSLSHAINRRRLLPTDTPINYRYAIPWSGTLAATWRPLPTWSIGGKVRVQSGVPYTPLLSIGRDASGVPVAVYGPPFSAEAPVYARIDVRIEKTIRLGSAQGRLFVDALNIFDRTNVGSRSFPLRNAYLDESGALAVAANEDSGVPRFVALGFSIDW
ncbi:MAG: TonB-dependent receptor [Pseudomonadota bacterium]|uniref:TonB-dependent receptor plug domain-containing protein n=1 Tax=Sphingomonas sp. ERG5 TaxID=1381597 RepID=UPI00054C1415|nr:TonB-dependent receptor [Sphingomonas sp. ERG5]